jgi:TPR repeat protein
MELRMIWASVASYALALGVFGSVAAGPFEDGEAAFQRGDYAAALKSWLPLANEGSAAAQNNIATMYHAGQGVPRSDTIATQWLLKSAANGNADAQYSLGLSYASGDVVPRDDAQAAAWYLKAANQGNTAAQSMLGLAYYKGQ